MSYHSDGEGVYHTDWDCPTGSQIGDAHRRAGKGGRQKCKECGRERKEEKRPGVGPELSLRIIKGTGPSIGVQPKLIKQKRRTPRRRNQPPKTADPASTGQAGGGGTGP